MAEMAFTLLGEAVKCLYSIYKNHKDLKREFEEVSNFLIDLRESSPILNTTPTSGSKLEDVKNTLQGKLESATKQVEGWSSKKSGFFSMLHSDERLRKIQSVRQKVKMAMGLASHQLAVCILQVAEDNNKRLIEVFIKLNISAQDNKRPVVAHKPAVPAKPNRVQHPKPRGPSKLEASIAQPEILTPPRSKSTGRATSSSTAPSSSKPRSTSAGRARRDKTVELYVPMDSDKQAKDVKENLEALLGVMNVITDQTSKQVVVVPHKGVTLNIDQLLRNATLDKKYRAPTLWSKRPR